MERCSKCVLSAAFPKIAFDETGVCRFCRDEMLATTEDAAIERARQRVAQLFAARVRPYDAILCNSGGKDSSYTLKLAVEKYGLRVLSFTLDNGFIAPQALTNIQRVVDSLGVDHVTLRPSMRFYRRVVKAATLQPIYSDQSLMRISAGCNACISLVNTTALRLAIEKRIPVILAGFTLGQIPANAVVYRNHFGFFQDSRKETLSRLAAAVGEEVHDYYGIPDATLALVESYPHSVNLLCLEQVTEATIVEEVSRLGWRRPTGVDGCSSNCLLNTFNNYAHERRFGFNPYELELSHLIRRGLMTREEALEKMAEQPLESLRLAAQQLGLSPEELASLGLSEVACGADHDSAG